MNDRFRFRAWDKVCGRMLYNIQEAYDGGCVEDKEGNEVNDCWASDFGSFFPYEGQEENEYIVEQCTGLKDKNGNLIYEGDIVKEGKIAWNDYTACFMIVFPDGDNREFGEIYTGYLEVIGNIHENPELLEGK